MQFVDFHCDTLMRLYLLKQKNKPEILYNNKGHLDIERLVRSNYTAQFFAAFLDLASSDTESLLNDAFNMADMLYEEIAAGSVSLALNYTDYARNKQANKLSAFLAVEEGGIIGSDLNNLDKLYNKGFRAITLTWNYENSIGYPNKDYVHRNDGLKPFGIEAIEKMDELGIIIDCSHLSDAGFSDIVKHGRRPFLATHSNARTVHNHSRNLTDDMIKELANKGGISGINYCGAFLGEDNKSLIEHMVRHIRHFINIGGREFAALGSDFDGIKASEDIAGAESMPTFADRLSSYGFTSGEIEGVCYKNAEGFLKRYFE